MYLVRVPARQSLVKVIAGKGGYGRKGQKEIADIEKGRVKEI
jgi:hypothetical protein